MPLLIFFVTLLFSFSNVRGEDKHQFSSDLMTVRMHDFVKMIDAILPESSGEERKEELRRLLEENLNSSSTANPDQFSLGREGNGGEAIALEFTKVALEGADYIHLQKKRLFNPDSILAEVNLSQLLETIAKTRVFAVERKLCSRDSDTECPQEAGFVAKNYPRGHEIHVNLKRWEQLSSTDKVRTALHEYFGIMGLERGNYRYSSRVIIAHNNNENEHFFSCQFSLYQCQMNSFALNGPCQASSGVATIGKGNVGGDSFLSWG